MSDDLDALLLRTEQEAFGTSWQVAQQSAGPWRDISGVFDRYHLSLPMEQGPAQSMRHVTLSIDPGELPAGFEILPGHQVRGMKRQADAWVPSGEYWQVTEVQPDAMGGLLLTLGGARQKQGR